MNNEFGFYNTPQISGLEYLETLNLDFATVIYHLPMINIITKAPLPSVKHLSMRGTDIQLPPDLRLCAKLVNMTTINLAENQISQIPRYLFEGCTHLALVNLSKNLITAIPPEIHAWVERHDVIIDLSSNPLICHCHNDAVKTIEWLHKHKHKYIGFSEYMCYGFHAQNSGSKLIADIDIDDYLAHCPGWLPTEIAALAVFSILFGIVMGLFIMVIQKYRYRVITCVIRILRRLVEDSPAQTCFDYDVYLSYDVEDLSWIHTMLLPELETLHGFQCCLPDRNFPLTGSSLPNLTCDFMDRCRCILVIMSKHTAANNYQRFEMKRAKDLSLTEDRRVMYVILDGYKNNITPEVRQVLELGNYIEWPTGNCYERRIDRFFKQLVAAIRGKPLCG